MNLRRLPLRVLAVILALWEPLNLAWFVGPVLTTIATRGTGTALFLLARIVVAGIGIAAGISLWREAPHARRLAAAALILSTIAAAITFTTALLPTNIMPGDQWLFVAAVVLFNGGWLAYLATRPNHKEHEDHEVHEDGHEESSQLPS